MMTCPMIQYTQQSRPLLWKSVYFKITKIQYESSLWNFHDKAYFEYKHTEKLASSLESVYFAIPKIQNESSLWNFYDDKAYFENKQICD